MSTSDRLDRKEIKQPDQFQEGVESGALWFQEHLRLIVAIAVGLVVALLAGWGFLSWQKSREAAGAEALSQALRIVDAPVVDAASAKPDDPKEPSFADEAAHTSAAKAALEGVRAEHGGTDAATVALVHLGRIAAEAGDLEQARARWQEFLDDADGHMLVAAVRLSLLRLDRDQGREQEVVSYLEKATTATTAGELPTDLALYELGTTYEALDRAEEARVAYQKLVDEHPDSAWTQAARQRLNLIGGPAPAV